MIRILIADDHPFVRRGVTQVLTDEFPGVVIGKRRPRRNCSNKLENTGGM